MCRLKMMVIGMLIPFASISANLETGKIKAQACTACHGANGISVSNDIPNLAGQKGEYIVMQLKAFRSGARKNPLMNAMAAQLSDTDIDNVAAFFVSLASAGKSEISDVATALGKINIQFPEDYKKRFKMYSKVDQPDKKRVRHNLANNIFLTGPNDQGMLPNGSFVLTEIYAAKLDAGGKPVKGQDGYFVADKLLVLATMEKRKGWGNSIPEELRNGDWNYALFATDGSPKTSNQAKCLACHKPLQDEDYLFSYKSLTEKTR